jgi:predicted peptidase
MNMLQRKNSRFFIALTSAIVIAFIILFIGSRISLSSLAHAISRSSPPPPTPTPVSHYGYIARTFTDAKGQPLPYYLYIPAHYNPQQKYPLVLLLHGGGERGNPKNTPEQNMQILLHQPYMEVWSAQYSGPDNPDIQQRWPCFVVVPQLVAPQQWVYANPHKGSYKQSPQPDTTLLLAKGLLDALQQEYSGIDANRLYITGLSLGGYGTWDAIERWPNYFAAAAPLSGAGDPSPTKVALLTRLPIWAFHGSNDPRVPVSGSRDMIKAIRAAGGHPLYTEFAGAGHGIWGRVYGFDANHVSGFFSWIFSQHKG